MITIEQIIEWSKPHPIGGDSKVTRIDTNAIGFSIVGGGPGLYGDFENDFEVAIFDNESGEFMTRFFYPDGQDDIIPYMKGKDLEKLVNRLIKGNDFQVR